MNRYSYDGPVLEFETCVAHRWTGTTYAPSESKARSNLTYQYKKQHNKVANTKIVLPGQIKLVQGKENVYGRCK